MIGLEDFKKIQLITARVLEAEPHPDADRLLVLKIDDGSTTRSLVAGIRTSYAPETLIGKTIVIVSNLEPATIRGVASEGMLLAVREGDQMSLLTTDKPASPGLPVG